MKQLLLGIVLLTSVRQVDAQSIFLGAGLGFANIPRAGDAICGGNPSDLKGLDLAGMVGAKIGRVDVTLTADIIDDGKAVMADCVIPQSGVYVDSIYEGAKGTARSVGVDVAIPLQRFVHVTAGFGRIIDHAWFIGAGGRLRVRFFRVDVATRLQFVPFEEVTRQYSNSQLTERGRVGKTETKLGWVARVVLLTR
ncbi:MAG TPA: hypothetical protein VM100_04840 [Longimicrobiales bacterium]|nr:hypothetical protein [Longimicrobiales bacterium]